MISFEEAGRNLNAMSRFLNEHATIKALLEGRHWLQMGKPDESSSPIDAQNRLPHPHGTGRR